MKAATHPRQAARLGALRAYGILDTPRETDFDEIVALASEICGVPISVVNLIDAERQWFKAEVGLGVRETPLETSICSHAILEHDFVEIGDTRLDRRMEGNDLVAGDPGLRFYAGALLKTEEGLPLGTLCVLDYQPRKLSAFQRQALQTLARQVMSQLDLRLALQRQKLLSNEIDHRVKNSLQAITSLVRLQRRQAGNAEMQEALHSVEQRIHAVSLLHEELYRGGTDMVDFSQFVRRLATLMRPLAPDNVDLRVDVQPCELDPKRASSAGIIVSEFMANSIKHAFPDGRAGSVSVRALVADGHVDLICEDDGVGASAAAQLIGGGLGVRIMEASASQLGGVLERTISQTGCRLRVQFAIG